MKPQTATSKPRVLLVGRTRYQLPFAGAEARKFSAVSQLLVWHLLARGRARYRDERLTLIGRLPVAPLDGLSFQLRLPIAIWRAIKRFRPYVIVAQDPFVAAAALIARRLARSDAAVVVEIHGDWRTATRLYGRRWRAGLAWPADAIARAAIRRADAARAISDYTATLLSDVRGSIDAEFPTFLDLEPFTSTPPEPLPVRPCALFVGVLERYKNVDGLLTAWQRVHSRLPDARLRVVGTGSLAALVQNAARRDASIEYVSALTRGEVAAALDEATCLVLPSRSEGMGRVVLEAFSRGRAVVASRVGGLPEQVADGATGLLVDPNDHAELEEALVRILSNRRLALELGENAAARATPLRMTANQWARSLLSLVTLAQQNRTEPRPTVSISRTTEPSTRQPELAASIAASEEQNG